MMMFGLYMKESIAVVDHLGRTRFLVGALDRVAGIILEQSL